MEPNIMKNKKSEKTLEKYDYFIAVSIAKREISFLLWLEVNSA